MRCVDIHYSNNDRAMYEIYPYVPEPGEHYYGSLCFERDAFVKSVKKIDINEKDIVKIHNVDKKGVDHYDFYEVSLEDDFFGRHRTWTDCIAVDKDELAD